MPLFLETGYSRHEGHRALAPVFHGKPFSPAAFYNSVAFAWVGFSPIMGHKDGI